MEHKSQLERVRIKVHRDGSISRNQCLAQHSPITRLASRIKDLEEEGYVFKPDRVRGDYVYTLLSKPKTRAQILADNAACLAFFQAYPQQHLLDQSTQV